MKFSSVVKRLYHLYNLLSTTTPSAFARRNSHKARLQCRRLALICLMSSRRSLDGSVGMASRCWLGPSPAWLSSFTKSWALALGRRCLAVLVASICNISLLFLWNMSRRYARDGLTALWDVEHEPSQEFLDHICRHDFVHCELAWMKVAVCVRGSTDGREIDITTLGMCQLALLSLAARIKCNGFRCMD